MKRKGLSLGDNGGGDLGIDIQVCRGHDLMIEVLSYKKPRY